MFSSVISVEDSFYALYAKQLWKRTLYKDSLAPTANESAPKEQPSEAFFTV